MFRNWNNRLKLACLSFLYAGSYFALDTLGVHDLTSPWHWLALVPLVTICVAERAGWISMFKGFSFPATVLFASLNLVIWVSNTRTYVPLWIVYVILGFFFAAMGFALLRVWTYRDGQKPSPIQ